MSRWLQGGKEVGMIDDKKRGPNYILKEKEKKIQ